MSVFVIAECGVNAGGKPKNMYKLIDVAKDAGADAVKFQVWFPPTFQHLREYTFGRTYWYRFFEYARKIGIEPFATAFDSAAVRFLGNTLEQKYWKIPSNQTVVKDQDLLNQISAAAYDMPLFISTALLGENGWLIMGEKFQGSHLSFLHCVSLYPTPLNLAELQRMTEIKSLVERAPRLEAKVGLSDHSGTIAVPLAAVVKGAKVIETHITLDKNQDGPDHKASLDPGEFKTMVKAIRDLEKMK